MRIGFAKTDITPRIGVELFGFGPFLNRRSVGVRDRLWTRALAVEQGGKKLVLVSCDLCLPHAIITHRVRRLVADAAGLASESVMVHCTHTHSGPATGPQYGWGTPDPPYLEILPHRVADACVRAVGNLRPARLFHAAVPCEGMGLNRHCDRDAPPLEDVLKDDWRPAKPHLTDTVCHVFAVQSGGVMTGFFSYFGCHPVVCCADTRYIHGDYAGVAANLLEREHPGSVGLFLQGAEGDVNSCVVHKPEKEALLALDVIAGRYAACVRSGLSRVRPLPVDTVRCVLQPVTFSRRDLSLEKLSRMLAEQEAIAGAPGASDEDGGVRMAAVYAIGLRSMIERLRSGAGLGCSTELQGFRIGPVAFLGTPFEVFQGIKNEVVKKTKSPLPLVLSATNDSQGYAVDRKMVRTGGYAARMVPMILGVPPYRDIHGELVQALLGLAAQLGF